MDCVWVLLHGFMHNSWPKWDEHENLFSYLYIAWRGKELLSLGFEEHEKLCKEVIGHSNVSRK